MTRPKNNFPAARARKFTIRLSPEEDLLLDDLSSKAGLSRSEYLRSLLTKKTPEVSYELVFNDPKILKIFSNLANITGNLNQIAHHLNSNKGWSKDLRERVISNLNDIQDMRKELKELTGGYRGNC